MKRRGFTLVELLIVIALIAILIGLLLPAVMRARTAGRRSQCANNLRQLGAAVQQFHQRHGTLPVYWGAMNNKTGEAFGGWLLHILPDLEEQNFFDSLPVPGPGLEQRVELHELITGTMIAPQIPASDDYQEGTWVSSTTGVVNATGVAIDVVTWTLVGRVGTPPQGPWYERSLALIGTGTNIPGIPDGFARAQQGRVFPVLQCSNDASAPMNWVQRGRDNEPWSLTNYMANAHVFLQFRSGRLSSDTSMSYGHRAMGGRYARAMGLWIRDSFGNRDEFEHRWSFRNGVPPRQFAHVVDGLSNTIMFGEAMRRCDNGNKFRFALLPTATQPAGDEHTFGIDPAVSWGTGGSLSLIQTTSAGGQAGGLGGFGNTLMFQQNPPLEGCNQFRLQANHDVLNVVMCDGSVRGISPRVTRREQCDPDVAGREFGARTYCPEGLGGVSGSNVVDGIWDMLMVPADPPGNVLANTGEFGKEK